MSRTFGVYGGRYVPETLIPALDELTAGWDAARADDALLAGAARAAHDLRRPPDAAHARRAVRARQPRLPQARGPAPHRRAQAEQRARPGGARDAGSASSGSSPRPAPASTASRPPPSARASASSASSTWAPRTCAARRPTSSGCTCSAPRCAPVEFGTKTLKEATSEAIRDWITNVETTHYLIGSCVGPAPYPEIVRDLQRVIGDEAREQVLAAEGRLPDAVIACVGGGSNAIGDVLRLHRRRGRPPRRRRGGRRGEPRHRAARPSSTAPARRCSPTTTARSPTPTRSPPGSTTRASAPSTPRCATPAAPSTCRAPTTRRSPRSTGWPRPRGSSRRSRARTRSPARSTSTPSSSSSASPGRGDKDLAEVLAQRLG